MPPKYNFEKIKFATEPQTFEKAVALYETGKVTEFKDDVIGYSAMVLGSKSYQVSVEARNYNNGSCECYLGQNDYLCKHMVAVAIQACLNGKKISKEEKELVSDPVCSERLGELSKDEIVKIKKSISDAMKYIKPYNGPSRIWFAYQNSLSEGCVRLASIVSELPVSLQTTKLLIDILLRLDKKLCTDGVDDSDGTVGGFIEETVTVLQEYVSIEPTCIKAFEKLCDQSTCFGWEESLVKIFDEFGGL